MPHVAFKFFLPLEVGRELRQAVTLRPDRLSIQTISWDQQALDKMVQQRLFHYSEGHPVRFEDLCKPAAKADVMERLIGACAGSPRTLLRLCQALIHHHVAHSESTFIERREVLDTIDYFGQQLEAEQIVSPIEEALPGPTEAPPDQGIFLAKGGHVWIDGDRLTPPLSNKEFRLLQALYRQSPEIVHREALIEAVWTSSNWTSESDEQNLRKLITRLRNRLDSSQRSRFIKNVRGRGYWLKNE
jgi:hypothetical protein